MRKLHFETLQGTCPSVARITSLSCLPDEWDPALQFLVPLESETEIRTLMNLNNAGLRNITALVPTDNVWPLENLSAVRCDVSAIRSHDVVSLNPAQSALHVLYRESDSHHALFLTNRCNSYCLMCSQPPTQHDDSWLVEEAVAVASHIKASPRAIGLTGGEVLLLRSGLRRVLDVLSNRHPQTEIEILTNGRLLADAAFVQEVLSGFTGNVSWLVPLYGHADFLHDYVVQSQGAFEETLAGLLNLQALQQPVQLRIVLIEPVLQVLPDLCLFIGRNLPFVREVALMACEPIGFALANRDVCQVDLTNWHSQLQDASRVLTRLRIPYIFMNTPLCALPPALWPAARQSISDWKRTYDVACQGCGVIEQCAGLFAWYARGWSPAPIKAEHGAVVT